MLEPRELVGDVADGREEALSDLGLKPLTHKLINLLGLNLAALELLDLLCKLFVLLASRDAIIDDALRVAALAVRVVLTGAKWLVADHVELDGFTLSSDCTEQHMPGHHLLFLRWHLVWDLSLCDHDHTAEAIGIV